MIYRYCAGIPRRINLLCDRLLITAYVRNTHRITARIVRQSMHDLSGVWKPMPAPRAGRRPAWTRPVPLRLLGIAVPAVLGGALMLPVIHHRLEFSLPKQVLALVQLPSQPPPLPQPVQVASATSGPAVLSSLPPQLPETELTLLRTLWQLKLQADGESARVATGTRTAWEAILSPVAATMGLEVVPFHTSFPQLRHLLRPCLMEIGAESAASQSVVWVLVRVFQDQAFIYREPEGLTAVSCAACGRGNST
jgi:hypothetical protein